jgi:hypothetical protein
MSWLEAHAAAWDAQYSDGRYVGDPPEPFVGEILAAAGRLASRAVCTLAAGTVETSCA